MFNLAGTAVDFQAKQLSEGTVLSEAESKGMNPFNIDKKSLNEYKVLCYKHDRICTKAYYIGTMYSVHA